MAPKLFNSTNAVTVGVYTALAALDVSNAWRFVQDYREPNSHNLNDHISAVNRYWRDQLASAVPNTFQVRACLKDDVALADWLSLFARSVAPVIVSLNLPQELPRPTRSIPSFGFATA